MATWEAFAAASPDLAAFGARRLMGRVAYLATVRLGGGPRIHPVTAHIGAGRLFVYMEPASPKAHDLRRDARYALHCSVEDRSGGEGELSVRGRARVIDDPAMRASLFVAARADGSHPQERFVVFELGIDGASSTIYQDGQPVRRSWRAT